MPRRVRDGGPWILYRCQACRRPSRIERNRAGFFLATAPPIVPLAERFWAAFSSEQRLALERKREYFSRRAGRKAWFHGPYADELVREGKALPLGGRTARRRRARAAPPPVAEEAEPQPEPDAQAPAEEVAPGEVESHYTVLGIEITADKAEIERAYRELAKQYHPDKFAGLDDSFQSLAHEKFKRINAARDALLEDLG